MSNDQSGFLIGNTTLRATLNLRRLVSHAVLYKIALKLKTEKGASNA
jgi:hypothetical protein